MELLRYSKQLVLRSLRQIDRHRMQPLILIEICCIKIQDLLDVSNAITNSRPFRGAGIKLY